ncbi:ARID domain-containing protein [Mycena sanguinolenta]|uniref:ARID domain-containing protein n=1 Tax=Mycena sanguinolenta TaxID=230812 RepID=A0A8H6XKV4_9AGAR|nr:ARID domain-containing protein [Mycena sanguinolenta]
MSEDTGVRRSRQFERRMPDSDYDGPAGPSPRLMAAGRHAPRATSTAVHHEAAFVQRILQGAIPITMYGGIGGNGGNGTGHGRGGAGGVGGAPRLIENFSGQVIIQYSGDDGQVNPGIGRIMEGMATIRDGVAEVCEQIQLFVEAWLRKLQTQLLAVSNHVPRGVSDHDFRVIDPVGSSFSVTLAYCRDYSILHDILTSYLRHRTGGRYIERGEYNLMTDGGGFIMPETFAQTIKAGITLEISIQRRVQTRNDVTRNPSCPHCHRPQATPAEHGWFKCVDPMCAKNVSDRWARVRPPTSNAPK